MRKARRSVSHTDVETPDGKYIGTGKGGEKSIVIPKQVRDMFDIGPGDTMLVLADVKQGIALVGNDIFRDFADEILGAKMPLNRTRRRMSNRRIRKESMYGLVIGSRFRNSIRVLA